MADTVKSLKEELKEVKGYLNTVNSRLETIEERLSIQKPKLKQSQETGVQEKPTKEEKQKKSSSHDFEAKIGMKWFARIGIVCLTLGIAFFLKYAFDNDWIGHLGRVIIGVVIGLALIVGGEIANKKEKYLILSRILSGGGFAVLYFAVFAAYHFETYRTAIGITLTQDIILLSIVVILSMIFAIKHDSKTILSGSFFLGYLTAFLSNDFGMFTLVYCLILTIALAAVTSIKRWGHIAMGGAIATYLVFMIWYFDYSGSIAPALYFLVIYFIIFTIQSFMVRKAENIFGIIVTAINSFFFYAFIMFWLEDKHMSSYHGLFTLLMAVVYLILAYLSVNDRKLKITHTTLCILFLTLTIPIQLDNELITIAWALEGLILMFLALRIKSFPLRILAYCIAPIVTLKTIFIDSFTLDSFSFSDILGSTRLFSYLVSIASFYYIAYLLNKEQLTEKEGWTGRFYSYAALAMIMLLIALETNQYWITVGWGLAAIIVLILGFTKNSKENRIVGIALFGLTLAKLFLFDMSSLDTLYRFISFIGLGVILLAAAFLYAKYKDLILGDG